MNTRTGVDDLKSCDAATVTDTEVDLAVVVNLMALPSRLISICPTRFSSPRTRWGKVLTI